jgi:hypothetical protein
MSGLLIYSEEDFPKLRKNGYIVKKMSYDLSRPEQEIDNPYFLQTAI